MARRSLLLALIVVSRMVSGGIVQDMFDRAVANGVTIEGNVLPGLGIVPNSESDKENGK